MGAEPWSYFVPYREDIQAALDALRQQEFAAGRYHRPDSDVEPTTPEEALTMAAADGTRSILDMQRVSETPDFFAVAPLSRDQLLALFGTDRPTHAMVAGNHDFYDDIERGQGIYIVVHDGGQPSEIFFAGYSFD